MSAPDTTKFQVNYKLADGTLLNLYAKDVKDLETGLTDLSMVSALIKSTAQELGATANPVATIKQAFPGAQVVSQAPVASANPDAPTCAHGAMRWNSGQGAKGPWQGWFCAGPKELPREQKCDTIWKR